MTTVVGTRFDITSIAAGTAAIGALNIGPSDQVIFGVSGNELHVYVVKY